VILPVVNESGASQAIKFEMKFKRVSRSKLNDLQKAQEQMTESEVVVDSLERDTDYVMDIAEGWRHVSEADGAEDLPFNRANVWLMLNNYPNAASVIVAAFFEATLGGGKRKN
jgi:phosphoribosylformimino-5-aminoimidazole carboxamide ribonucleotide (ProFAR) isomerase